MGTVLWLISGIVAFLIARIVPHARPRRWWPELIGTLVTALLLGAVATALDFGGWNELDWRAGAFCILGSLGIAGILRVITHKTS